MCDLKKFGGIGPPRSTNVDKCNIIIGGHRKIVGMGGTKKLDRVGGRLKYGFREGDDFMGQVGGREGELFLNMTKNFNFGQFSAIF